MRNHDAKYDRFECGEGSACDIAWGPIIGGGLGLIGGLLGGKKEADAIEKASDQNAEFQRLRFPWIEGAAQRAATDAGSLYGRGGFAPQVNPLELLGRKNTLGYAEGRLPGLIDATQQSWMTGLDPGLNPYVGAMIESAQQDLTQDYMRNVLPAISDRAQAVGGYGGSRQGVAQGIASGELLQGLGNISTRMLSQAHQDALGQQRAAWGAAPQMMGLGFLPSQAQQDVGAQYRGDAQQPARNLQGYLGTLAPFLQGGPGSAPYQAAPSPWGSAVSGAIGGGMAGNWLGDLFPSFNPTPTVPNPVPGDAYMPGAGYTPGGFGF